MIFGCMTDRLSVFFIISKYSSVVFSFLVYDIVPIM